MYYRKTAKHAAAGGPKTFAGVPAPDDCFAEKAAKWLYILAFIVALLLAAGLHRFFQQLSRMPLNKRGFLNAAAWTTAYNPAAGAAVVRTVMIPELAINVASAPDGQGVEVITVYAGGRAEAAGIVELDQITVFNGRKVRNPVQFQDIVSRARPESIVKAVILRNGILGETSVQIGEGEFVPPAQAAPQPPAQPQPVPQPPRPPAAMTL